MPMNRVNLWDGWRSKENYSNNKFTNCRPTTMNNETHEWLQDCKNGKDLYSYIKPFHTRKVCLYRCMATYRAEEDFPSCFQGASMSETQNPHWSLRHCWHRRPHLAFNSLASGHWKCFCRRKVSPDFQSIGTSPGTLEDSGIMDNFLW